VRCDAFCLFIAVIVWLWDGVLLLIGEVTLEFGYGMRREWLDGVELRQNGYTGNVLITDAICPVSSDGDSFI
jgi:hypothetical protein